MIKRTGINGLVPKHFLKHMYIFCLCFVTGLSTMGFSSSLLFDVSDSVLKSNLYNEKNKSGLNYLTLFAEADKPFVFNEDWENISGDLEKQGDLEFAFSKVFNNSSSNSFEIRGETQDINDTSFTILDTQAFVKNPQYSTMHTLVISGSNNWSYLSSEENIVFISSKFANALASSRGIGQNKGILLIGTNLRLSTPGFTEEDFIIGGITLLQEASNSTGEYLYNLFNEDVFFISHKKANEFKTTKLMGLFQEMNEKKTLGYYGQIENIAKINKANISFSSEKLNTIIIDFLTISRNNWYFVLGLFLIIIGGFLFFCALVILKIIIYGLENSKKSGTRLKLKEFLIFLLFINSLIGIVILKSFNVLNFGIPALNIAAMNLISTGTLFAVFLTVYYYKKHVRLDE